MSNYLPLIIYSHVPAAIITLILGIFLLIQSRHLKIRIFFSLSVLFFFFIIADLFHELSFLGVNTIFCAQTAIQIIEPLIIVVSFYFLYYLLKRKDAPFQYKVLALMPLIPVYVLIALGQNVNSSFLTYYTFAMELSYFVVAVLFSVITISRNRGARNEMLMTSIGVCLFILLFFVTQNIFTGRLFGIVFDDDYLIYSYFCMPLVVAFLAYLAIRFKVFRVRLMTSQIFILSVFLLIISQFFFLNNTVSIILNTFLVFFMILITHLLLKDMGEEMKIREQVEELALNLSSANQNLKKTNIKLEELSLQKTEFISIATHQLRGPLGSIKGYESMILEGDFGPLKPELKEAVETMLQSTLSLSVIVEDYLDVSRIEQGQMKYDFKVFDVREMAENIVTEFTPIISIAHLELSFEYKKEEHYFVHGDKGKIKQVFTNLLDNSIKYTPTGSIHLKLEKVTDTKTKQKNIIFSIKDTGVGVAKDVIPELFARFSRAPDASKTNMLGTGLGLFVARKIIEVHQGKVWVESEGTGHGSKFFVELKAE